MVPSLERPAIPRKLAASLLYRNDHTCCICRERNKDVEIHHIDGKNRNNSWLNLAVLCRDCHSKVTGVRGLGRGYLPEEVRNYKSEWERSVGKRRSLVAGARSSVPKVERDLLLFEIKKATYELASTKKLGRVKEILEYLDMFYIFETSAEVLLDQVQWVAPMITGESRKVSLVTEYVLHYFWHLIGPKDVKARNADVRLLNKAADLFASMAEMESGYDQTANMKEIIDAMFELYLIAEDYKLRRVQRRITRRMKSIKKDLTSVIGRTKSHPLKKTVDGYLADMN
jgi:hypothetical protein